MAAETDEIHTHFGFNEAAVSLERLDSYEPYFFFFFFHFFYFPLYVLGRISYLDMLCLVYAVAVLVCFTLSRMGYGLPCPEQDVSAPYLLTREPGRHQKSIKKALYWLG